eukprot:6179528-Pleurochrysis_carterae.AAC.1
MCVCVCVTSGLKRNESASLARAPAQHAARAHRAGRRCRGLGRAAAPRPSSWPCTRARPTRGRAATECQRPATHGTKSGRTCIRRGGAGGTEVAARGRGCAKRVGAAAIFARSAWNSLRALCVGSRARKSFQWLAARVPSRPLFCATTRREGNRNPQPCTLHLSVQTVYLHHRQRCMARAQRTGSDSQKTRLPVGFRRPCQFGMEESQAQLSEDAESAQLYKPIEGYERLLPNSHPAALVGRVRRAMDACRTLAVRPPSDSSLAPRRRAASNGARARNKGRGRGAAGRSACARVARTWSLGVCFACPRYLGLPSGSPFTSRNSSRRFGTTSCAAARARASAHEVGEHQRGGRRASEAEQERAKRDE